MREILFKGKRKDNNEWSYGYLIADTRGRMYITLIESHCDEIFPETVCEYTGITDKNGKKIFEGDIVKTEDEKYIGIVKYGKFKPTLFYDLLEKFFKRPKADVTGLFCEMTDGSQCLMSDNCKVIGNIHDNPELLEVEK